MKSIKKVFLSTISILGISVLVWCVLLMNPSTSYANTTKMGIVTVYHNLDLDDNAVNIINDAVKIIEKSDLFNDDIRISLCMNDDNVYPNLHPFVGGPLAYAIADKTIIKNCNVDFKNNEATTEWEVNNFEFRRFNLTWLLAHEFTHNLQQAENLLYSSASSLVKIDWKLEGHAEYIAKGFKDDGQLKEKIDFFIEEAEKKHAGLPVFLLEDGTCQIFSYYKYSLLYQFLVEENGLSYNEVIALDKNADQVYKEMLVWAKSNQPN